MITPLIFGKQPADYVLFHGGPGAPGNIAFLGEKLSTLGSSLLVSQNESNIKPLISNINNQITQHVKSKSVLIGHSFGAWIGGLFASTFPQKVKKLVLLGSGPLKESYAKSINKTRLKRLSSRDKTEFLNSLELIHHFDVPRAKLALRKLQYFTEITDHYKPINKYDFSPPVDINIFRSLSSDISEWRTSGKLLQAFSAIKCPVTIIHGEYDPHPLEGITEPLKETGLEFKLFTIPDCGHEPWMEQDKSDVFFRILENELKTV